MNVIHPVVNSMNEEASTSNNPNIHTSATVDKLRRAVNNNVEAPLSLHSFSGSNPYKNMVYVLLHALFLGDENLSSQETVEKIMYAMQILLDLLVLFIG